MDQETIRYRVRTKPYLCLSPEEAVATGITVGEQTVEEVHLVENPGFGYQEYAVVRDAGLEALKKMPVDVRGEKVFSQRREAVGYLDKIGKETHRLCGVKDTRTIPRNEIGPAEEGTVGDFMQELKKFETKT